MVNLLEWPSWTIVDVQEGEHDYHITAYRNEPPAACVSCGTVGELQLFGKREHPYLTCRYAESAWAFTCNANVIVAKPVAVPSMSHCPKCTPIIS
jgi:hypothetical protein